MSAAGQELAADHGHHYVGATWTHEQGNGEWTGEDVRDIIWLMLYTGYRISGAVFFDMGRLRGN